MPVPWRVARAGDYCVLLEPGEGEARRLQPMLDELCNDYGGVPNLQPHLTCQRFALPEPSQLPHLIDALVARLPSVPPIRLTAQGLDRMYAPFWGSRLLRWEVACTTALRTLTTVLDDVLRAAGITPHFSSVNGWMPRLVTALESISEGPVGRHGAAAHFPRHLFDARRLILSRIRGRNDFERLEIYRWQ